MLRATSAKKPAQTDAVVSFGTKRVKFPGIVAAAAALGVRREHLWAVLSGRRKSKSLLRRYRALKRG